MKTELPLAPDTDTGSPSRRVFIQVVTAAVACGYAGMIGYPVYKYLASPIEKAEAAGAVSEVTLPKADELPKGSATIFKFGNKPAMLIHLPNGEWTALSAVCTHLACTVQYEPEKERIYCACHGGTYDPASGKNVSGPPPRPLDRFQVKVQPGSVTVTRS
jgi:cytochrome b6-f complex iron-sulfur subunit